VDQALLQFIGHPTFLGGFVVLVVAIVYGLVRGTAAMTRAAVAAEAMRSEMVGIRSDFAGMRESTRDEHERTRGEIQSLREEVLRVNGPADLRRADPREERPFGRAPLASRPR
jgi:hypothetical protein